MPTADEIHEYRQWRGRLINAVWDAEAEGAYLAAIVPILLPKIGAQDLPAHTVARLVNDLISDGLLRQFSLPTGGDLYPTEVKLTSAGRLEVERWIADDSPTEHLALPPSQTFNTHFHGPLAGSSVVVGSSHAMVNTTSTVDESTASLVQLLEQLVSDPGAPTHEQDRVAADIEVLRTPSGTEADLGSVKAALGRLQQWTATAVFTGAAAGIAGEVHQLIGQML